MAKILMVATAFGTTNLARGLIIHTNPDPKADPRSRFVYARDQKDVERLEKAEVARRATKAEAEEGRKLLEGEADEDVHATAAKRVANVSDADRSTEASTGLDTRATLLKQGGSEDVDQDSGGTAGDGEEAADDVDEAPASGTRRTRAKPADAAS